MTITLRSQKGAPLTHSELDGNFTDLASRTDPEGLLNALDNLLNSGEVGTDFADLIVQAAMQGTVDPHPFTALLETSLHPALESVPVVAPDDERAVFAVGQSDGSVKYRLKAVVNWTLATPLQIAEGEDSSEQITVGPGELHDAFTWHKFNNVSGNLAIQGRITVGTDLMPAIRGYYELTGNSTVTIATPHNLDANVVYRRRYINTSGSSITIGYSGSAFRPEESMPASFTLDDGEMLVLNFELMDDDILISRGGIY